MFSKPVPFTTGKIFLGRSQTHQVAQRRQKKLEEFCQVVPTHTQRDTNSCTCVHCTNWLNVIPFMGRFDITCMVTEQHQVGGLTLECHLCVHANRNASDIIFPLREVYIYIYACMNVYT